MEGYFKLALLLGSVYMAGCQVQQMTERTVHNLLTRVRDLEIAVKQLVEIQNSQAGMF
jgi:outer membrane murein-binding lipoprotein Lpp